MLSGIATSRDGALTALPLGRATVVEAARYRVHPAARALAVRV
jgi:hypothetical protein